MGTEDMRRQQPNVAAHGAARRDASSRSRPGARTLKEAVSAAIRDWVANVGDTHYVIGSAVGPAPFPALVRDLQRVIGDEARAQILERAGRLPDARDRLRRRRLERDRHVRRRSSTTPASSWSASRPAGEGIETGRHGAPLTRRRARRRAARRLSAIMQDEDGQILEAHSISAGLDYPGTGPEHALLRDTGRARYEAVTDAEALAAFQRRRAARGHHPGARVRARDRLGARTSRASAELDLVCLPAAATRTSPRCSRAR